MAPTAIPVTAPAPSVPQIWLSAILPFTGGGWDSGVSIRIGAEIMLEQVNQNADLLPGYNLNIVWQDGLCDGSRASTVFLKNVLQETFDVFAPGVPVEDLNADGVGMITTEDVEGFGRVWTLANISAPVGVLGGGCSAETKAISNAAHMARFPIVSGASTFPGLSDRAAYPNFWRTILPDTSFPAAWITMAQMFGFLRATVVIGETHVWKDMAAVVVAAAQSKSMQLDGVDLSDDLTSGFRGYQISLDSERAASEAAKGLRERQNRVVISLMYERRNRILFCEAHKLGLDNFVWMAMGWLTGAWWRKPDTDCPVEVVTQMAWGMITANMQFWRSDMDTRLHCSQGMTAAGFKAEWLARQGVALDNLLEPTAEGFLPASESATVADAVCMYSKMLHAMLHDHGFSLDDLQRRGRAAYEKVQELFAATSFEGITGHIQFKPGAADPEGSVLIQHLQAFTGRFVDIASYGSYGELTFLGLHDLRFKLPGEIYFAGPKGATRVEAPLAAFSVCRSGQTLNYTDNICKACAGSQEFVSEMGFCACRSGYAVADGVCVDCLAGTFSSSIGSTSCEACPMGRFSASDRETACTRCPAGTYQDEPGQTSCKSCRDTFTTNGEGSESAADCWCGAGTRLGPEGLCEDCGEESATGVVCLGGGDVRVAEGFFAEDSSLSIFQCFGGAPRFSRCTGGVPPDVCAAGREGLACSSCVAGMKEHPASGTCIRCDEGAPGYMALVVVAGGSVCTLAGLYVGIDRRGSSTESHALLLFALVFSLAVTTTQQLGILAMFTQVEWPDPMRSVLNKLVVMTFDLDFLNLRCIAETSELSRFIIKLCIVGMCVFVLLLVHVTMVLAVYRGNFQGRNSSLVGSIGTIFMVFYISLISLLLGPLQCVQHPNGKWTVRSYPAVICWETGEHHAMVGIGVAALTVPLAYLAKCAQCVWQFPSMMRQGNIEFLRTFYFLFFRYRAEAYWYSLVHVVRSIALANLPIVPSVAVQLIGMQVVLISQFYCVVSYRPWRVPSTNSMDLFYTMAIMFVVAGSSFYVDQSPRNIIAWLSLTLILKSMLLLPVVAMIAAYRTYCATKKKEFQFFICHHKAGAGSFARLLKMQLQRTKVVTRKVFIDCDNLTDLDVLFDHVASSTEVLVIVSSKELFLRLWCVGEVATAMINHLAAVRVTLPDFEEPSDDFIEGYDEHLKDLSILANRGISVDDAKAAMRWSCTLSTIQVDLDLDDDSLVAMTRQVISSQDPPSDRHLASRRSKSEAPESPVRQPRPWSSETMRSQVLIVRDETNLEATAAGMVLAHMLYHLLTHSPDMIPRVLPFGGLVPTATSRLLLLCTPGALEQLGLFQALHSAARSAARCLPVVVDESFRFPSATFREDHLELAIRVCASRQAAELLVDDVADIFKTIAPGFRAGAASEAELSTKSAEIAERLLAWGRAAQDVGGFSFQRARAIAGEQRGVEEIDAQEDTGIDQQPSASMPAHHELAGLPLQPSASQGAAQGSEGIAGGLDAGDSHERKLDSAEANSAEIRADFADAPRTPDSSAQSSPRNGEARTS